MLANEYISMYSYDLNIISIQQNIPVGINKGKIKC